MEFRLPELGEGVSEGELIKWKVKVGDQVLDDQPLCEIMTDKATIEIPSPFAGKIKEIHAKEGEVVKVHQLMVTADALPGATPSATHTQVAPVTSAAISSGVSTSAPTLPLTEKNVNANILASPATRRLAHEKGIDLSVVTGTGPKGRVLMEDVLNGGASRPSPAKKNYVTPTEVIRTPIRGMRKKIYEKMHLSKTTAAHFTYVEEADATELVKLRTQAKVLADQNGIKLSYLPFVMKAMVAALKRHPRVNSTVDDETLEIITYPYYHISLSVQTEEGLTVPVVKHVEQKSIFELATEIADLVDRARKKKLTKEDFQGSTITLTNAGSIGGLFATPIINYPEVAILGFNKIARKPVVKTINGREEIVIRDWTYFSISMDHRILDGAEAAEFLKTFIGFIENPEQLFLENALNHS